MEVGRQRKMGLGEAVAIFVAIMTSGRPEGDKAQALGPLLGMDIRDRITEQELVDVLGWPMERQGGAGEREDEG